MIAWLTRFSIRTRMVLLVAAGLIVILYVVGTLSAQALRESTQAVLDERLRLAQLAAHHIDDHLVEDVLPRLERMAQDEEGFDLTDTDPQPERRALRELYAAGLFTYDVFVTDARGVVLLTEPDLPQVMGTDLSTDPHVREALATGEPRVSGLLTAVATGQPLVSFVVPVVGDAGLIVGLIGGATDPTSASFVKILPALRPPGASHADVVDGDGMVLASTDPDECTPRKRPQASLAPLAASTKGGRGTLSWGGRGRGEGEARGSLRPSDRRSLGGRYRAARARCFSSGLRPAAADDPHWSDRPVGDRHPHLA